MNNKYLITIIICILFFVGCINFNKREPPKTVSEELNKFVNSASYKFINLDEAELYKIVLSEDDLVYQLSHDIAEDEPMLGHLSNFTFYDGRFYVYDGEANAIFIIDKKGSVEGPYTREGRGPGEHVHVENLKINHQYVWAADVINARINRYTHGMEVFDSYHDLSSFLDLNDEFIITENSNSRGIAPVQPDQGRIIVRALDTLTDTLETILPRIIPTGYQPQLFNSPRAVINHNHKIVAAYYFLPWLFLFDEEFTHISTLIVEYSKYEDMDIPSIDFFRQLGNEGFGGVKPITEFKLMDNNEIFFSVRRELIHLMPSSDGTYQVNGRYRFYQEELDEPLWISDIFSSENEGEYYVGSWYHLFRFTIAG